jgi:hypothetical protein
VDLIDDGVGERDAQSSVAGPVECRIDDDGFRNARTAVVFVLVQVGIFLAEGIGKDGLIPLHVAKDCLCVGIDEQLVFIETMTLGGVPWTVNTKSVTLTGTNARDKAVPHKGGAFFQAKTIGLVVVFIEEAELNAGGVL